MLDTMVSMTTARLCALQAPYLMYVSIGRRCTLTHRPGDREGLPSTLDKPETVSASPWLICSARTRPTTQVLATRRTVPVVAAATGAGTTTCVPQSLPIET